MPRMFHDRHDAGRQLAARLLPMAGERPIVLALPRGGVPVGFEVARALRAPLDVLVVRKIGAPGNLELGMGAVAEGGVRFLSDVALGALQVSPEQMSDATQRAERELEERLHRYRGTWAPLDVSGRTVIVVDDGLATGGTAHAAARCLRARHPARLVLAVPVGATESLESLESEYDEIVCLLVPEPMLAIGYWYDEFEQTSDAEVAALLDPSRPVEVRIPVEGGELVLGDLVVPQDAAGLVVFAHGSGSSRHSPRNRQVAAALNAAGHATLLIDLLTPAEEHLRSNVFDIELLAGRLGAATRWIAEQPGLRHLGLGYFGASTGAGAALWAAADAGGQVRAVVSRGGRPDLAAPRLADVRAPTLLIVGGRDDVVIGLNRRALAQLRCPAELEIVRGATHLFEEPGTLEAVQHLAAGWFTQHLAPASLRQPDRYVGPGTGNRTPCPDSGR